MSIQVEEGKDVSVLDTGVIALRAFGSLILLFVMTRILGKKQISQLTFFEYITGIALGDLVGFMSTDIEANYWHGAVALFVWFAVPFAAEIFALKSKKLRVWLGGKSTVFIQDGKVLEQNLKKERYTSDELLEQLRSKNVFTPADVEYAMLEPSGDLSIMLKKENQALTPKMIGLDVSSAKPPQAVIMDGNMMQEGLKQLELSEKWLLDELGKQHLTPGKVFLAVADFNGGLYVDTYEKRQVHAP